MAVDKKSGLQMVPNMVLSLTVVTLGAGVIYLFTPHDASHDPVRPVSFEAELKTASRAAPYPVAAPRGLPEQWRATSVTYQDQGLNGAAWHLGFITPGNQYAAVEQSDAEEAEAFVTNVTHSAEKTGESVRLDGETWARYEGKKYDALVRTEPEVTTVVTGTAPFTHLKRLADALDPGARQGTKG